MEQQTSEFGKGFVYNLFLFAKHQWRLQSYLESYKKIGFSEQSAVGFWFNGAADHFFELEIPPQFNDTKIGQMARDLQDLGLYYRRDGKPSRKDFDDFFKKCEDLMMLIDESLGIEPKEAEYK